MHMHMHTHARTCALFHSLTPATHTLTRSPESTPTPTPTPTPWSLGVYNPPNASPVTLRATPRAAGAGGLGGVGLASDAWVHTKALYTIESQSRSKVKGVTGDMCRDSIYAPKCSVAQVESTATSSPSSSPSSSPGEDT